MAEENPLIAEVKRLAMVLDKRRSTHARIEPYYEPEEGHWSYPRVITEAKLTQLYRWLMPYADAPWGSLVVDSKLDRLEVAGVTDTRKSAADAAWSIWQANNMDSESKLAHNAALLDGRAFATVWTGEGGGADIALDDATQMVVEFEPGSRKHRRQALRRWRDGDRTFATLYRPDEICKFQTPTPTDTTPDAEWVQRFEDGEDWPLHNPLGVVPVVELGVNRRLKPGTFPHARGEFEHVVGLIDRINLLTFLGLVVAVWMGFPLRGVIGQKIEREVLRDDDGNALIDPQTQKEITRAKPVVQQQPGDTFALENPDAKIVEWGAADRKNLSIVPELDQLAALTKTPRHYLPMEGGLSNIAAETIMANEGAMHAAVKSHKATLGEGWEDVLRLACKIEGVTLSPQAAMDWSAHEARSLAERADAASKLKDLLPWQAVAETALNIGQDQIARWSTMRAADPLAQLVAAAQAPAAPVAAVNGNGATP